MSSIRKLERGMSKNSSSRRKQKQVEDQLRPSSVEKKFSNSNKKNSSRKYKELKLP
jgi:hypothetical protein